MVVLNIAKRRPHNEQNTEYNVTSWPDTCAKRKREMNLRKDKKVGTPHTVK
jgi:hypothetical protein